jgi:L-fuconolactonase
MASVGVLPNAVIQNADVPDVIIDAHHHLWDPAKVEYPWLTEKLAPIDRRMEFDSLGPLLRANGIDRTVLVQSLDSDADTDYMLAQADAEPAIAAVVGWVPLERAADAAPRLAELQEHPRFRGVRCSINFEPDPDWLLRDDVAEGLALLEREGVPLDVVSVRRRHLEIVPILAGRYPALPLVLDHLSKPPIKKDADWIEGWRANLARAAECPTVFAKVSGLFPARGAMDEWTVDDVRPFFEFALETFGADRLMWGSDWPIADLAGGYQRVWDALSTLFAELSPTERSALLGGTAARFYGIGEDA